jgi:hypothetical protein
MLVIIMQNIIQYDIHISMFTSHYKIKFHMAYQVGIAVISETSKKFEMYPFRIFGGDIGYPDLVVFALLSSQKSEVP